MNKSALKAYAPQARNDFIAAMTARAAQLGINEQQGKLVILPASINGQVMLIDGTPFPASLAAVREQLMTRIAEQGLPATIEAIAYSWFNRLAALRFMELHDGYLEHGIRVLSSATDNPQPDILAAAIDLAQQGALPGLKIDQIIELKTAGNKDNELYKILLIAQCNALHHAMPLLFEKVEDDSEILLPDNLLRTDSIISKLVNSLDESDWQEVEVIGWLYQFYISQKKDAVIGKVVKSEDIPAATQLFTPNWIVKYLVQNSVGRLWTSANPNSALASQWDYYIPPTEQSEVVHAQLAQLIVQRVSEDGDTLNPESITVLDPACGSGHILVEAYDCIKAMYLERGYRLRDIPRLICEKNLFGLDIDTRAAQLASFALLMKARADDRRLLQNPPKLNIFALQNSHPDHLDHLHQTLASEGISRAQLHSLLTTFEHATTFGSLIQIPSALSEQLNTLHDTLSQACLSGDIFVQQAAQEVLPLVQQAQLLAKRYDTVIANPPYMGGKGMNETLKAFAKKAFPDSKSDLFAMFIERGFDWCKPNGFNSMVTMQSWMFLSSYETMREKLLRDRTIDSMAHLGARAFSEISGEVVQTTASVMLPIALPAFKGSYLRLVDGKSEEEKSQMMLSALGKAV